MEMFYIFTIHGLHEYLHLSKLIKLYSIVSVRFTVCKLYFHYEKAILFLLQKANIGAILILLISKLPLWYQLEKGSPEVPFLAH